MITCKQSLDIGNDSRLMEQSFQRRSDLLLDIVVVVYGDVILKDLDGVLSIIVVL